MLQPKMNAQLDIQDLAKVVGFRVVYRSASRGWHIALLTGIHTGEQNHPELDRVCISFPDPIDGTTVDWIPIDQIVPFLRPISKILPEDALKILHLLQNPVSPVSLTDGQLEVKAYPDQNGAVANGVTFTFKPEVGPAVELYISPDLQIKWQQEEVFRMPPKMVELIDLLTRRGYDVRGWINKGLALDLTKPGQDTVPI